MNFNAVKDVMVQSTPIAKAKNDDLLWRSISAMVLIPSVLMVSYIGEWLFVVMILLGGLISIHEWITMTLRLTWKEPFSPSVWGMVIAGHLILVLAIVGYLTVGSLEVRVLSLVISLGLMVYLFTSVRLSDRWWTVCGVIYITIGVISLLWLREQPGDGLFWIIFLFLIVWMTDIGAFFIGQWWGRKRLAPRVSPKKTWTGFIGGILIGGVTGGSIAWINDIQNPEILVVIALFVAIICHMGDLFESAAKRHFNCKDAGDLIPGHGGLIDRIDGLLASAQGLALCHVTSLVVAL